MVQSVITTASHGEAGSNPGAVGLCLDCFVAMLLAPLAIYRNSEIAMTADAGMSGRGVDGLLTGLVP